jgi:Putative phage tail protein
MATLLFSALGTALGGPLGGVIGALVGRQVDSAIVGQGRVSGPRLKELEITTSSYGAALARHYGRMRVPGHIIWSTDLQETSETSGGKNRPDVTTYNYSVSFAVAIASRPILSIGRIWADGRLLRGEAGDIKVDGRMRVYHGEADQLADPLIAQIETTARCPAYRGLAYVVFEDLDLTEFYNRIPALTFEVISDETFGLAEIVEEVLDDSDANVPLAELVGFTCEGPLAEVLPQLDPMFPINADASDAVMVFARERLQSSPIALPEAAISVADGDFGGAAGYARRRAAPGPRPPEILRYYDIDRDYQPGLQRVTGRPDPGQPRSVEIAAAMTATSARTLAERMRRKADWSRDRLSWRTRELDPAVSPGSVVTVGGQRGKWRVEEWELRDNGVELSLVRLVPTGTESLPPAQIDPGRINPAPDLLAPPTLLAAFELPADGPSTTNTRRVFAAASSSGSNWAGAALFSDDGSAALVPLGPSGRSRSVIGITQAPLPPANPLLIDREHSLEVALVAQDMTLQNVTAAQLAAGWNKALVGSEIIQFARAQPIGGTGWQLSWLLRGRGGTENAVAGHTVDERFVLLDQRPRLLDLALVGTGPDTQIVAAGRGDPDPVAAGIALQGISLRPPSPVHTASEQLADGALRLCWTRRARGAWLWPDGADVPLVEEIERYQVDYGPVGAPIASWNVTTNELVVSPAALISLQAQLANGPLHVRQLGSYATSEPAFIANLA